MLKSRHPFPSVGEDEEVGEDVEVTSPISISRANAHMVHMG